MKYKKKCPDNLWVAIDVGTTKICVLIAEVMGDQNIEIRGIGKVPSDGLKKGVVVDVARTIRSISRAVQEAEIMAGCSVESAYVGISGSHIRSVNSHGMVPISKGMVRPADINDVVTAAKTIPIPEDQQILHVLPQYFLIDGQERVLDPHGMHGVRLEAYVHMVIGNISSVQNLVKCCERAGIAVKDIILEQLASADAVLTPDERAVGIGIIDIGGGTSDLAVYQDGSIRHTKVFPVAGNHFTNDLAIGLHTTLTEAERVKKEQGMAYEGLMNRAQEIDLKDSDGNDTTGFTMDDIRSILEPRAYELLGLVHDEIVHKRLLPFMPAGVVLTGGGALLRGLKECGAKIFDMPIRVGMPRFSYPVPSLLESPVYATSYGILVHAIQRKGNRLVRDAALPLFSRIAERMKVWVSDFF